jgi:ribosomal protein L4
MLKSLNLGQSKVLVLLPQTNRTFVLSSRNIKGVTTFPADKISAYDVLNHGKLLIFKSALDTIAKSFGSEDAGTDATNIGSQDTGADQTGGDE